MAHHKSALKRIRQSRRLKLYNRLNKRILKNAVRAVNESQTFEEAGQNLKKAVSVLDKLAARKIIHKNNAANKKSSLSKMVNKLKTR